MEYLSLLQEELMSILPLDEIICGDSIEVLKGLPDNSIDMVVTSPPYDNLRYYADGFLKEFDKTIDDFEDEKSFKKARLIFKSKKMKEKLAENNGYSFPFEGLARQLARVVKEGGVIVWVVGDAVIKGSESGSSFKQALYFMQQGFNLHDTMIYEKNGSSFPARRDGNRYSQIFEYMFVFSNGAKPKTSNLICDKKNKWAGWVPWGKKGGTMRKKNGELVPRNQKPTPDFSPRNNIWKYNTGAGYSAKDKIAFKHPAIFPEQLAEDHILTWTEPGDIVLDPLNGAGTTTKMALLNDRRFIGIDILQDYCDIAEERIEIAKGTLKAREQKLVNE